MKDLYFDERQSLIEEIESESIAMVAGGASDACEDDYHRCNRRCDRLGDEGEEEDECKDECDEEYEECCDCEED